MFYNNRYDRNFGYNRFFVTCDHNQKTKFYSEREVVKRHRFYIEQKKEAYRLSFTE